MKNKTGRKRGLFIITLRYKTLNFFEKVLSNRRKKLVSDLEVSQYAIVGRALLADAMQHVYYNREDLKIIEDNCHELGRIIIQCYNHEEQRIDFPVGQGSMQEICKGIKPGRFLANPNAVETLIIRAGFIADYRANYYPSHNTSKALNFLNKIKKER